MYFLIYYSTGCVKIFWHSLSVKIDRVNLIRKIIYHLAKVALVIVTHEHVV